MVDGAAVALRAVARQTFTYRQNRLALRPFADWLAVTLSDEPDWLPVCRALFLERLTIEALARALDGTG
jgi:hypothetical protein